MKFANATKFYRKSGAARDELDAAIPSRMGLGLLF
jgi:hypothetical protein